jgi:hypothetical protein
MSTRFTATLTLAAGLSVALLFVGTFASAGQQAPPIHGLTGRLVPEGPVQNPYEAVNTAVVKSLAGIEHLGSLGSAESQPSSVTGRVIVKACAERYGRHDWLRDSRRLNAEAAQQAAECSATWADPASDLGMVVDGTFYEFDKTGLVLAKTALSKATDRSTAVFTVVGRIINKSGRFVPFTQIGGSSGGFRIPPEHKIKVERIEEAR